MRERKILNIPLIHISAIIITVIASIMLSNLEYNYIHAEGLPYREVQPPTIGVFYYYHLGAIIPLIGLIAFFPFIYEALGKEKPREYLRMTLALGLASLFLGILLQDSLWFAYRMLAPIDLDPFAHQWIRPSDYTASMTGYVMIFGITVPLWYFTLIPPIIAIYLALLITPRIG